MVKVLAERLGMTEGRLIHEGIPAGTVSVDPGTCILSDTWESACGTGALTLVKEDRIYDEENGAAYVEE